jgi:hypothetical protein
MGWREYAAAVRDIGHVRHNRHTRSEEQANVPIVPIVLALPSEETARTILADWHRHLSALNVYEPPEGIDQNRWGMLVEDACWLYETHASRLVRDGWSALDLFGVLPSQRGWGGLADRIQGARNVLFDDQGKAHWTRHGVNFSISRGVGEALGGSGARLVWDLSC